MDEIDQKLELEKKGFLRRAFTEEWPTMGNHLAACGVALGAATGFSHIAPEFMESDAAISGIATVLDAGGYWAAFLPQLLYRDRQRLRDDEGNLSLRKIKRKAIEYLGYIGVLEGAYSAGRFLGQLYLVKNGWEHDDASLAIQLSATAFFTAAFPPIRYAVRQWSEK